MIKILVDGGADVNTANRMFGRTPLHYAADCGHMDCVRLMIEYGGDVTLQDSQGKSALDLAVSDELRELMVNSRQDRCDLPLIPPVAQQT
jgi:ankyrin repeat protein